MGLNESLLIGGLSFLGLIQVGVLGVFRVRNELIYRKWLNKYEHLYQDSRGYPKDWSLRRVAIYRKYKGVCASCGWQIGSINWTWHMLLHGDVIKGVHIHHIKPISAKGNHTFENLECLCPGCHGKKHPDREHLIKNNIFH